MASQEGDKKNKKAVRGTAEKSEKTERSSANKKTDSAPSDIIEKVERGSTKTQEIGNEQNTILSVVLNIQKSLQEQEDKLNKVSARMDNYDENMYYEQYEDYHGDENTPEDSPLQIAMDSPEDKRGNKRSRSRSPEAEVQIVNNRFDSMSKRFKTSEKCSDEVDNTLASNINELFMNGMEEGKLNELLKDEKFARPENCESLRVVKLNKLVWEAISASAKSNDKKLQNVENSIIKASTLLVKTVNNMAKLEKENSKYGEMIDDCNDILALLGNSNRQINLARKDFLRPELKEDYAHLCNHSIPFTSELFGDDVTKAAKEIEDTLKVGNKIHRGRGRPFYRSRFRGRFRGSGMPLRGRGFHSNHMGPSTSTYGATPFGQAAKNGQRRGQNRPLNKQ